MKNNKGFVLTETLVVVVFLVTIFTFVYISINPLMGKYEDMTNRISNIDIVYKLYHIRKMIKNDDNKSAIVTESFKRITCANLSDETYCNKLMEYLELNDYILVYADNINNHLSANSDLLDDSSFQQLNGDPNKEMYDYISKYKDYEKHVLVLLDLDKHVAAHLAI